jgi:hypothetical protein
MTGQHRTRLPPVVAPFNQTEPERSEKPHDLR